MTSPTCTGSASGPDHLILVCPTFTFPRPSPRDWFKVRKDVGNLVSKNLHGARRFCLSIVFFLRTRHITVVPSTTSILQWRFANYRIYSPHERGLEYNTVVLYIKLMYITVSNWLLLFLKCVIEVFFLDFVDFYVSLKNNICLLK